MADDEWVVMGQKHWAGVLISTNVQPHQTGGRDEVHKWPCLRHNQNAEPFKIMATCAWEGLEDGGGQYSEVSLIAEGIVRQALVSREPKSGLMTHIKSLRLRRDSVIGVADR